MTYPADIWRRTFIAGGAVAAALFGLRIPPERWAPLTAVGLGVAVTAAGSFFAAGGYASVVALPPALTKRRPLSKIVGTTTDCEQ